MELLTKFVVTEVYAVHSAPALNLDSTDTVVHASVLAAQKSTNSRSLTVSASANNHFPRVSICPQKSSSQSSKGEMSSTVPRVGYAGSPGSRKRWVAEKRPSTGGGCNS